MGRLASIMRKSGTFLTTNHANPFIDSKLNKRCPRLGIQGLCVHTRSANLMAIVICT